MYEHNGMETPSGRLFRKLTVSKQKHWQQLYLLILISGFTWFSKRIISVHKCYARITFLSDTRSGASLLRYESSLFNLEVSQHGSNAFYPVSPSFHYRCMYSLHIAHTEAHFSLRFNFVSLATGQKIWSMDVYSDSTR